MKEYLADFAFWRSARLHQRSVAWKRLALRLLGVSEGDLDAVNGDPSKADAPFHAPDDPKRGKR